MKASMKSLLAVCSLALTLAADPASLTGKWKISMSIAGNDNVMTCDITQKDNAVTGACSSDQGNVELAGKVDGDKITWSYKSEYNGMPLTVQFAGAMTSPTLIKGSVEVPEFGVDGEFTASRSE
jgi:hypothetical protein